MTLQAAISQVSLLLSSGKTAKLFRDECGAWWCCESGVEAYNYGGGK